MPGSPALAAKLKKWRKKRNLTQQAAAVEIGVPLGTYRDWEQEAGSPRGLALKALNDHLLRHASD